MPSKTRKLKNRVRKSVKKNTKKSVKKNTRKTFKRKSLKRRSRNCSKKNTRKYLKIQKGGWNIEELRKVVKAYLIFYNINFNLNYEEDIDKIYQALLPFLIKIPYETRLDNYLTSETNEGERVVNTERLRMCHLYMTVKIILEYSAFTSDTMPVATNLPMEELDKVILRSFINSETGGRVDVQDEEGNTIEMNPAPLEFRKAYESLISMIIKSSEDAEPELKILNDNLVELFQKAKSNKEKRLADKAHTDEMSENVCAGSDVEAGSDVDLHCHEGDLLDD